jgi:molecular chaperone HtpG
MDNNLMDTYSLSADTAQTISLLHKHADDIDPIEEACLVLDELIKNSENAILWSRHKDKELSSIGHLITIAFNSSKRTITVTDTGIGMNKSELISYLGIIGKSGTKNYRDNTLDLIPFQGSCDGVGFYSVFLIATRVQVFSKFDDSVYVWEWKKDKNFTIDGAEASCLERGTRVIVYLKDDRLKENEVAIQQRLLENRDVDRMSYLRFFSV